MDKVIRLLALDYDGTIAHKGKIFPEIERFLSGDSCRNLVRVIVSGRSIASLRRSWPEPWPADYLIFSSGAALYNCSSGRIEWKHHLPSRELEPACRFLEERNIDYMVHYPIPENHRFYYRRLASHPDFERRLAHYAEFATPMGSFAPPLSEASQILAIGDRDYICSYTPPYLSERYGLIFATSPLDGVSSWLEIFSPQVDKGQGLSRLCASLGIDRTAVLAVGNDYNDLHMLEWAGQAALVSDAPRELLMRFPSFDEHQRGGALKALESYLR